MTLSAALFELLKQRSDPFEATVRGISMGQTIPDETVVRVEPLSLRKIRPGEVVVFRDRERLVAHRLRFRARRYALMLGDGYRTPDFPVPDGELLGRVVAIQSDGQWTAVAARPGVPMRTSVVVSVASLALLVSPWLARKVIAVSLRLDRFLRD